MAEFTVADIVTPLRALLRDNSGQTNNEWTATILYGYIGDGIKDAQRELSLADADFFLTSVTFNVTDGLNIYEPATNLRKVVKFQSLDTGVPTDIPAITWEESLRMDQMQNSTNPNIRTYMLTGTKIRLFPMPAATVENALGLLYERDCVPTTGFTTSTQTFDLPYDWFRYAMYSAAVYAMLQDQQDPRIIDEMRTRLLMRMRADYRDREKGKAQYVRYAGGDDTYDDYWGS